MSKLMHVCGHMEEASGYILCNKCGSEWKNISVQLKSSQEQYRLSQEREKRSREALSWVVNECERQDRHGNELVIPRGCYELCRSICTPKEKQ